MDGGDYSFSMIFEHDEYYNLRVVMGRDNLQHYLIILPNEEETSIMFEGVIKEIGLAVPIDDKIMSDVSIKISGGPNVSSGTQPGGRDSSGS